MSFGATSKSPFGGDFNIRFGRKRQLNITLIAVLQTKVISKKKVSPI
jgi:hypothetical protein